MEKVGVKVWVIGGGMCVGEEVEYGEEVRVGGRIVKGSGFRGGV